LRQTGTASTTSPAMSGSGRPLRGRPTTQQRVTRRSMDAVRLAQKTSANRTGELSRAVRTCAHLRTAIATDPRLDKVMAYAAQPVISDFAACSLPSLRGGQRPQGPALHTRATAGALPSASRGHDLDRRHRPITGKRGSRLSSSGASHKSMSSPDELTFGNPVAVIHGKDTRSAAG
jgi:hypothetical protein